MRKIIFFLIIIFSSNYSVNADNIKDFQIDGISVGDSLLDYMSKGATKISISIHILMKRNLLPCLAQITLDLIMI